MGFGDDWRMPATPQQVVEAPKQVVAASVQSAKLQTPTVRDFEEFLGDACERDGASSAIALAKGFASWAHARGIASASTRWVGLRLRECGFHRSLDARGRARWAGVRLRA